MWRARWDPGVLKAEALALLPCGLGMAFSQSHVMAARRHQHSRLIVEVDEYSSNPTQAFTFYNIIFGDPESFWNKEPVPKGSTQNLTHCKTQDRRSNMKGVMVRHTC